MARCMVCRKSLLRCNCWSGGTEKKKPAAGSKVRNVVKNGIEWCGKCSCRVINGRCTNAQCSSGAR